MHNIAGLCRAAVQARRALVATGRLSDYRCTYGELAEDGPDGVVLDTWASKVYSGSDQIAALARDNARGKGATNMSQFVWTIKVEAAPQGATGKAYVMTGGLQGPGKPIAMTNGGQYWDDLVKTSDGWHFKKRTFYRSTQTPPPAQAPATN